MNFLSSHFVLFLPPALLIWYALRRREIARIVVMAAASLVFYADDHVWFVAIILACCIVDWAVGQCLSHQKSLAVLAAGVGSNLALLCVWKYAPLALATVASTTDWVEPEMVRSVTASWIVPLGVSFYAFSGIAYMVDVYRGDAAAEPSLLRYTLFAVFFPHLVAGPILRARDFLVDLGPGKLPMRPDAVWEGAQLIALGTFKKAVIGDRIAFAIDPYFAHAGDASTIGVWSLPYLYLYAFQIYFDFSGYTDIARGLGLWFGFRWPENFNQPYLASSVKEFWRRWHITLSLFLRDYLYVPLGGNRRGKTRKAFAIMATMSLGGLWHGASWTFLVWGGLHGAFLIIHMNWEKTVLARRLAEKGGMPWALASVFLTFHAVTMAWAFFRVPEFADALICLRSTVIFDRAQLFAGGSGHVDVWLLLAVYGVASAVVQANGGKWSLKVLQQSASAISFKSGILWGGSLGLLLLAWLAAPTQSAQPFIYFQF